MNVTHRAPKRRTPCSCRMRRELYAVDVFSSRPTSLFEWSLNREVRWCHLARFCAMVRNKRRRKIHRLVSAKAFVETIDITSTLFCTLLGKAVRNRKDDNRQRRGVWLPFSWQQQRIWRSSQKTVSKKKSRLRRQSRSRRTKKHLRRRIFFPYC